MTDEQKQESQRRNLLASLFGTDVPTGLGGQLLRTADVASLFQVSERTVSEWARRGRIPSVRTPGGHRRYPADEVRQLLRETEEHAVTDPDRRADVDAVAGRGVTQLDSRRTVTA
ncbi:MAG: helix-turn-helix domain-containing protein [Actinomycetes bacterium]